MRPGPPTTLSLQERVFLSVSNYIFTAIFVVEMMVKVQACLGEPLGLPSGVMLLSCPAVPTCYAPVPFPHPSPPSAALPTWAPPPLRLDRWWP